MRNFLYASWILMILFCGCKKNIHSLEIPPDARINFFNASHYPTPFIAQNLPDPSYLPSSGVLNFNGYESYPLGMPGGYTTGQGTISYMAVPVGEHEFYFADTARIFRARKKLNLRAGSYTTLYLMDSLLHYELLEIPVDPFGSHPDKIRISILNLVPDLILNTKMVAGDGSQDSTNLPRRIRYKTKSPVIEPALTHALDGSFFFRFYDADNDIEPVGVATIEATPGREYTVVLRGYRTNHVVSDTLFTSGIVTTVRTNN